MVAYGTQIEGYAQLCTCLNRADSHVTTSAASLQGPRLPDGQPATCRALTFQGVAAAAAARSAHVIDLMIIGARIEAGVAPASDGCQCFMMLLSLQGGWSSVQRKTDVVILRSVCYKCFMSHNSTIGCRYVR